MKLVCRSLFWNAVLAFLMVVMAALVTAVAVYQFSMSGRVPFGFGFGFGLGAAVCWAAAIRALVLGVRADTDSIVIRSLGRTTTINWSEIESIGVGGLTSGAASLANSRAPSVIWRKPDDVASQAIELSMLGSYGSRRKGVTLEERAVAELNARLSQWRKENRFNR
jgi:hypothetical protein